MIDFFTLYQYRRVNELLEENIDNPAVRELVRINSELSTLIAENAVRLDHRRLQTLSYSSIPGTEGPEPSKELFVLTPGRKSREIIVMRERRRMVDKVRPLTRLWRGEPVTGQGRAERKRRGRYGARQWRRAA